MPARMSSASRAGSEEDGPIVATIFVLLKRISSADYTIPFSRGSVSCAEQTFPREFARIAERAFGGETRFAVVIIACTLSPAALGLSLGKQ